MLLPLCLLLLAGLEKGSSLRCYSCISTEDEACIKLDKTRVPLNSCGLEELRKTERHAVQIHESLKKIYEVDAAQEPQLSFNCLKQHTKLGNKHIVLRGCQLAPSDQLDICVQVKKENKDFLFTNYCSLCNSDACNIASLRRPLEALLLFSAVLPIVFLLLS